MAVKKTESFPKVRIRLVKSLVGRTAAQRAVVRGLGLNKLQSSVIREKRPEIMGMVRKIDFMLEVTEVEK
ncbi:MAG TPA: 50S ribosomal protein L30 [Candidatus Aminicenantes bacterium]|jgi:large subunit ribosomal protein L30|nr:50S ribosomal protein L30 [Candidatus Aminicenantes bacterium]HDP95173.1 50S ribosomal protein L30 [Candidatus Aminicenantes bacterium]